MTTTTTADRGPTDRTVRPFGLRDKIGYMFGDFGNDFSFILQAFFFMVFYTNVMGINPAHVGTLLLVARLLDAFTDVGMGRIVDRIRPSADGRFRPWIRRMAIPVALASSLMYLTVAQDWSYGGRVAYMTVTYLLWGSIFYTAINIPYGSMAAVISRDPADRASLSVFRSVGATLAVIFISVVVPLLIFTRRDGQSVIDGTATMWTAIGMSAFAVLFYFLCYANVRERVVARPEDEAVQLTGKQLVRSLATNRALLALVVGALLLLVGTLLAQGLASYLWLEYFNNGRLQSVAGLVGSVPMLLLAPFAARLAKRVGKRELGIAGMALTGVAYVAIYLLRLDDPVVFLVLLTVGGLGLAIFNLLIWAFITDVLDYQELRSGRRDDGTVYAVYSWARKLGQALAGGLSGWVLGVIGYQASTGEAVEQTDRTLEGIYAFSTVVPGVIFLVVAAVLAFWYPLGKKQVENNVATLAQRHEARIGAVDATDDHA
jgi:GPH family glycoside/pentoside/hexuronide:cation symporter